MKAHKVALNGLSQVRFITLAKINKETPPPPTMLLHSTVKSDAIYNYRTSIFITAPSSSEDEESSQTRFHPAVTEDDLTIVSVSYEDDMLMNEAPSQESVHDTPEPGEQIYLEMQWRSVTGAGGAG